MRRDASHQRWKWVGVDAGGEAARINTNPEGSDSTSTRTGIPRRSLTADSEGDAIAPAPDQNPSTRLDWGRPSVHGEEDRAQGHVDDVHQHQVDAALFAELAVVEPEVDPQDRAGDGLPGEVPDEQGPGDGIGGDQRPAARMATRGLVMLLPTRVPRTVRTAANTSGEFQSFFMATP